MVIKLNNKPILFVNSISFNEVGKENQNIFDSMKDVKNKLFHKLDDLIAFLYYGKRPFVTIYFNDFFVSGEVLKLDKNVLFLRGKYDSKSYKVKDILEIKISYLL